MAADQIIFAGVDVSSGRKPVTLVALDEDLNILALQRWAVADAISSLAAYESVLLAVNSSSQKSAEFKKSASQAGFKQASAHGPQRWLEADAQQCFLALCTHELLARRSIEGRIQRALILYEQRLQITDPMDFFEEITRHKLMQGSLPQDIIHSARELDALMAAYAAWMVNHKPGQVHVAANRVTLLKSTEE